MVGEHAQEDVRFGAPLGVMEDRPFSRRMWRCDELIQLTELAVNAGGRSARDG
jgi:hypothetical protein